MVSIENNENYMTKYKSKRVKRRSVSVRLNKYIDKMIHYRVEIDRTR